MSMNAIERFARDQQPWTNVYGLARTLLAIGGIVTLAFNPPDHLFRPLAGVPEYPVCSGPAALGLFCQFGSLEIARWVAIAALLVVASGWRPRFTAPLHWWVACSYQANAVVIDGGDQVAAVLTLLLLPVALTDGRKWHWGPPPRDAGLERRLIAGSAIVAIRVQVAAIYLHAAVGKAAVAEWIDGTAVYYFFSDPLFGPNEAIGALLLPIVRNPVGVASITWGTVILELMLFAALLADKKRRRGWLIAGLTLHAGIAVVHGLISFMFSMHAAVILYLRPTEAVLAWPAWPRRVVARLLRERVPRLRHAAAVSVLLGLCGCYESVEATPCGRLASRLDEQLGSMVVPGAAMLVETDDDSCLATAGVMDLESRAAVDPRTRFALGSIGKTFTATIALQLVEETRLSLDDTVARWFPEVPSSDVMTVANLLDHTSGIDDYTNSEVFWGQALGDAERSWSDAELVSIALQRGMLFAPGDGYAYSNAGYVLLGMIVQRVVGRSIEREIDERILEPLGMDDTAARWLGAGPDSSKGYGRLSEDDRIVDLTEAVHPAAYGPAGAMASTPEDMAVFLRSLDRELLSAVSWRSMTRMRPTDGERYSGSGLGVRERQTPLGPAIATSGRLLGYSSVACRFDDDAVAVLLVNRRLDDEVEVLFDDLLESYEP